MSGQESANIVVRPLTEGELAEFGPRIAALEENISYPLGEDRFHIDHGPDYFAFFQRLGDLTYVVATRGDQILAVLAAVERRLPGVFGEPVWYLGDLKVTDAGRGLMLAQRLLERLRQCRVPGPDPGPGPGPRPCYGISMNPGDGSPNRVARLLTRALPDTHEAARLHFYTLDAATMTAFLPTLVEHRGPVGFLSLAGTKDIVLASTGKPMPLWHAQFGSCADPSQSHEPRGACMFCCPAGDALDLVAQTGGHEPMASATVLQSGLPGRDWSFVLTSDI